MIQWFINNHYHNESQAKSSYYWHVAFQGPALSVAFVDIHLRNSCWDYGT